VVSEDIMLEMTHLNKEMYSTAFTQKSLYTIVHTENRCHQNLCNESENQIRGIQMRMRLSRKFKFDAAHKLIDYQGVCGRIHGHTYELIVTVEGEPDETGMIIDFFDMKKIVEDVVISRLDHTYLNNFYEQPTVENVAADIFEKLQKAFEQIHADLFSVKLCEGEKSCVEVFSC